MPNDGPRLARRSLARVDYADLSRRMAAEKFGNWPNLRLDLFRRQAWRTLAALDNASGLSQALAAFHVAENAGAFHPARARAWAVKYVSYWDRFAAWADARGYPRTLYLRGLVVVKKAIPLPNALRSEANEDAFLYWLSRELTKAGRFGEFAARVNPAPPDAFAWARSGLLKARDHIAETAALTGLSREAVVWLDQATIHPAALCASPAILEALEAGGLSDATRERVEKGLAMLAVPGVLDGLEAEGLLN